MKVVASKIMVEKLPSTLKPPHPKCTQAFLTEQDRPIQKLLFSVSRRMQSSSKCKVGQCISGIILSPLGVDGCANSLFQSLICFWSVGFLDFVKNILRYFYSYTANEVKNCRQYPVNCLSHLNTSHYLSLS